MRPSVSEPPASVMLRAKLAVPAVAAPFPPASPSVARLSHRCSPPECGFLLPPLLLLGGGAADIVLYCAVLCLCWVLVLVLGVARCRVLLRRSLDPPHKLPRKSKHKQSTTNKNHKVQNNTIDGGLTSDTLPPQPPPKQHTHTHTPTTITTNTNTIRSNSSSK